MKTTTAGSILLSWLAAASPLLHADPLFESLDPVAIRISAPLRAMARDRSDKPKERDATLTLLDGNGADVNTFDIQIRPRGNSRRDREVCRFPPLRINFKKGQVDDTLFAGQDKLKLVTHCQDRDRHLQYVYKEYLVYRMLNGLTDAGFRVRPLVVHYVDSERTDTFEQFGFFIEDDERLAARLGLTVAEPQRIDNGELEGEHASLMDLFQFMIGNTDYSFLAGPEGESCCHNARLLQNDQGKYLPMPYDFDITGFVDPPYAVVDYQLPIKNVRQRLFRGICRDTAIEQQALTRFRQANEQILAPLRSETALEPEARQRAVDYIEGFFAILDDPKQLQKNILKNCRG